MKKICLLSLVISSIFFSACDVNRPQVSFAEAVKAGDEQAVAYYLKHGGQVNQTDQEGTPFIMLAAEQGSVPVVKKLLDAGANVDAKNKMGETALMDACMMSANKPDYREIVNMLIAAGADVNAKDMGDAPVLLLVSGVAEPETVKGLLSAGADPNATDPNGVSALMVAAISERSETVKALLDAGADPEAKGKNGWTALMFAAGTGNTETVKTLLAGGADPNATDPNGVTVLMAAGYRFQDNEEIVQLLKQAGATE